MPTGLQIEQLCVDLHEAQGVRPLLADLTLAIEEQQTVALVGASGSGKTSLGLAILGLLPQAMCLSQGRILFQGQDLTSVSDAHLRKMRGRHISMIFQEPLSAFNPVFRIGQQIAEVLQAHTTLSRAAISKQVLTLLDLVDIPEPLRVAQAYPHQLSAGLRQRAMIAQALAASPRLVIADEPTSNLDVTVQARIIALFQKLRKQLSLSLLLITHDLGLVRVMADHVYVLHQGCIVDQGQTADVLEHPRHVLTQQLMRTMS